MGKLQGTFSVMPVADLVQWARSAQKTGRLQLFGPNAQDIIVNFLDGRIVYSSTTTPRCKFSSYLVHMRYCTQEDIQWARAHEEETGARLGALLVASGRLNPDLALETLTKKTVEDLCDVFLWRDGAFEFTQNLAPDQEMLALDLDPIKIVNEGLRRVETWNRLQAAFHPTIVFDRMPGKNFALEDKWREPMVCANVWSLIDGVRSVDDILLELPFSRYQVFVAFAELGNNRFLSRGDQTEGGQRELRVGELIRQATEARENGRWTESIQILEGLSARYPRRTELSQMLLETLTGFRESVYKHNFVANDIPVVTIGSEALKRLDLDPEAAFLVTRIDGKTKVGEILRLAALPEVEALRRLKRLLDARIIDFPYRNLS